MEINQDDLRTLYQRADQYHIAKVGKPFYDLYLEEDGSLKATCTHYFGRGGEEEEVTYIDPENLTMDLDLVREERLAREAEEMRLYKIKQGEADERRRINEKAQRRADYLKLKKEFENEGSN